MTQKAIVFDDEHLQVIHLKGDSDVLIVTFGDLMRFADGNYIPAEKPLYEYRYSALGFIAKKGNWYPYHSVLSAIGKLSMLLSSFSNIIGYGGSMGGYAVLKFSKLMNMTKAVSLVPQYSIDLKDIIDRRYNKYFNQEINGEMKITSRDISNTCHYHVIYDPHFSPDVEHMKFIEPLLTNKKITLLRFSGHGATGILASSSLFNSLITIGFDEGTLNKMIKEQKRESPHYLPVLFRDYSEHHPKLFLDLYRNCNIPQITKYKESLRLILLNTLLKSKYDVTEILGLYATTCNSEEFYLKTSFNKVLCFNLISNQLFGYDYDLVENYSSILKPCLFQKKVVYIDIEGCKFLLNIVNDHIALIKNNDLETNSSIVVMPTREKETYSIKNKSLYLSARPEGSCQFTAHVVKKWETFEKVSSRVFSLKQD